MTYLDDSEDVIADDGEDVPPGYDETDRRYQDRIHDERDRRLLFFHGWNNLRDTFIAVCCHNTIESPDFRELLDAGQIYAIITRIVSDIHNRDYKALLSSMMGDRPMLERAFRAVADGKCAAGAQEGGSE